MEIGNNTKEQLKSIIERVEHVNEEIKGLTDDRSDIFAEAKGSGFCPKTLRKIVALRKLSEADRQAQDALLETYLHALEMI